jgi:transposase
MKGGPLECKGNYASDVKTNMPGWISATRFHPANDCLYIPINTGFQWQKGLAFGLNMVIIIFTFCAPFGEVPMPNPDAKLQTLQQQGTLNPRPEDVRDELFLQNEFFDPRDLVQVKYEMLRRVETDGKSVTEAAARFGFSRPSFYQALSALEQHGLGGLVPHKRGPKQAHKLTDDVMAFIVEQRQKEPSVRPAELARLIREHFGTAVHPRSIERRLRRHPKKRR